MKKVLAMGLIMVVVSSCITSSEDPGADSIQQRSDDYYRFCNHISPCMGYKFNSEESCQCVLDLPCHLLECKKDPYNAIGCHYELSLCEWQLSQDLLTCQF